MHNDDDDDRQCDGQRSTVRQLPLRRLLHLREQAVRADNTAAVEVLDRLIADRDADDSTPLRLSVLPTTQRP